MNVTQRTLACVVLLVTCGAAACEGPPPPLSVEEGSVLVLNQTDREWRNVRIVVNDHFNGGVPRLEPGGRLNAPLSMFQTSYGQRFDRSRMSAQKIEVTATDAAGAPVTLKWP